MPPPPPSKPTSPSQFASHLASSDQSNISASNRTTLSRLLSEPPLRELLLLFLATLSRVLLNSLSSTTQLGSRNQNKLKAANNVIILLSAFNLGRALLRTRNKTGLGTMTRWKLVLRRIAEWADGKIVDARLASITKTNSGSINASLDNPAQQPTSNSVSAKKISEMLGESISTDPDLDVVRRALDPRIAGGSGEAGKRKKKNRQPDTTAVEPIETSRVDESIPFLPTPPTPSQTNSQTPPPNQNPTSTFKMALLVRTDLGMGKGKAAAQCSHAALAAYKSLLYSNPGLLEQWEDAGSPKIVLKVDSEGELLQRMARAREKGIVAKSILDAGRTQIAAGSRTVAAIGPGSWDEVDAVCKGLKLF